MNTIQQTVTVPPNRRLRLDLPLPEDIPVGETEILVVFSSVPETHVPQTSGRLGGMRGLGVMDKDLDIKAFGREEITALFEGRE